MMAQVMIQFSDGVCGGVDQVGSLRVSTTKKTVTLVSLILVAAVAAVLIARTISAPGLSDDNKVEVVFGAVLPLTGEVANWGQDSAKGIELAIKQANAESTMYRFSVTFEDSKGQASEAVAATRKLVTIDKAVAIIGDNVSGPTVAIVPVADGFGVPVISPSASSPKLTGMSRYFFRVFPSNSAEGSFMADFAAEKLGAESVAILYINNDFGVGLQEVFEASFKEIGGSVGNVFGYNEDETDFRPFLTRVLSARPDAVYVAGYYKDGGAILRQAEELGLDVPFLGSTTFEDPQLLSIAGRAAEGLIYPVSTGYDATSTDANVADFQEAFRDQFSQDPGLVAALAYDCAVILTNAVEGSGPTASEIRDQMAATTSFIGATGEMTFDEHGDVHKPIYLRTVRDGAFVAWPAN
ncbi:MAG: ABC transporter substrate-binding protein [Planctomycetota bacterium]